MHNLLLSLALLLPQAGHDDALHAAGQCPNGPNCPRPVRPGPNNPNKPDPIPEPPHKPDKPKPHKPMLPDLGLGLSDEDALALLFAALLFGGAMWYFSRHDRNQAP